MSGSLHWLLHSDGGLLVRILIGSSIFVLLAAVDLHRHGNNATRWREYAVLLAAVAAALLYGAVNDQVTVTISPEYFLNGKELSKTLGDAPPMPVLRWEAAKIGLKATWTAGLLFGVFLLLANNPYKSLPRLQNRQLLWFLPVIVLMAAVLGALGGWLGYHGKLTRLDSDFVDMVDANMYRPAHFMSAWGVHLGGYAGGLLGTILSVAFIVAKRRGIQRSKSLKLQQSLTLEEFREMSNAINRTWRYDKPIYRLVVWLECFVVVVLNATQSRPRSAGFPASEVRQNLWVCLAPSLCVITFLMIGVMRSPLLPVRRSMENRPKRSGAAAAAYLPFLSPLWIVPAVWPQLSIFWMPTPEQLLWAAFAPWCLYFAAVRFILTRRRVRAIDDAWESSPSLKRLSQVEITNAGIAEDDGMVAHYFQWAYFKYYQETEKLIVLTSIDGMPSLVLAKRAIADDQLINALRTLLSEKICEGEFKRQARAFPVIDQVIDAPSTTRRVEQ